MPPVEGHVRRKWLWRFLIAGVVLLVLAIGFVVALPWLARPMVAGALSAALGRPVTIAALRWDPAAFSVVADDVHAGRSPDELAVRRITVIVDPRNLDRHHVAIDRITIEAPTGTVDLDALADGSGGGGGPPKLPLAVTVREVEVSDAALAVHLPRAAGSNVAVTIAHAGAADVELADGALQLTGDLTGTVDGAPLTGKVELRVASDEHHVVGSLSVTKLPVREGVLPLPASLTSLTGTLDATARLAMGDASAHDTLELDLRVAKLRAALKSGPTVSAAQVSLPAARIDLADRRIDLGPVNVQEPVASLDLAAPDAKAAPASGETSPWSLRSGPVTVRGGELRLRRGAATTAARIDRVRWDGLRDGATSLTLTATATTGGTIAVNGTVRVDPLSAELDVRVDALTLAPWANLLALPLPIERGALSGSSDVVYQDGLRSVRGDVRASDVKTRSPDPAHPTDVMAAATAAAAFSYTPGDDAAIELSSATLSYPYAMVVRRAEGTFPYTLLGGGSGEAGARTSVRVERLTVVDGKVEFVDETLQPAFWSSLTSVAATAETIAVPPGTVGHFTLTGKRDELSPVSVAGALTAEGLDARVEVTDVLLDSLNPYVAPLLGYRITAGRLSTVATTKSQPPLLVSVADVALSGVDVSQIGTDVILEQSGVPLTVALGLISDSGGRIDLNLPFSIDTRSGDVAVGSVVWQAVRKAIVTALTSPLRILGSLFGTRGAPHAFAVEPIPFPVGSGALDTAGRARVDDIARIVQAHQGLLLVLLPQITDADVQAVGAGGAEALAKARNAAVRAAFTDDEGGPALPAKRVMLAPWASDKDAQATQRPGVYVELQDAS